jgi:hypothetical protein
MKTPIAADEAPIPADKASEDTKLRRLAHTFSIAARITRPFKLLSAEIGASSAAIGVSKDFCIRQPRRSHHA